MLKLLIDNQPVNLSEGFSMELYQRNPFFTKEGTFTLDIDIDLADPQNALVYQDIYRLDQRTRPAGRQAILYDAEGILINGTEAILRVADNKAKIQIVGGNSELNYVAGGDRSIRALDLGHAGTKTGEDEWTITDNDALQSIRTAYPQADYACVPVATGIAVPVYNANPGDPMAKGIESQMMLYGSTTRQYIFNDINNLADNADNVAFRTGTHFVAQPYLCAIIRKVFEALGYTLTYNAMEDTELAQLLIIHGYDTTAYAEMLEAWTVSDFISRIEDLGGVVAIVDNNSKEVRLDRRSAWYQQADTEEIAVEDIIGYTEKKFDQRSSERTVDYRNVRYDAPATYLYKRWMPDPEQYAALERVNCPDNGSSYGLRLEARDIYAKISSSLGAANIPDDAKAAFVNGKIYREKGVEPFNGMEAVLHNIYSPDTCHLTETGHYVARTDKRTEAETVLKLIPAEFFFTAYSGTATGKMMPVCLARNGSRKGKVATEEELSTLAVISGESQQTESEATNGQMYIAFYLGIRNVTYYAAPTTNAFCPVALPQALVLRPVYPHLQGSLWCNNNHYLDLKPSTAPYDLRITGPDGLYERFYKQNTESETTHYEIRFLRQFRSYDPRRRYIIANQPFYCIDLKQSISPEGRADTILGTFIPITPTNP